MCKEIIGNEENSIRLEATCLKFSDRNMVHGANLPPRIPTNKFTILKRSFTYLRMSKTFFEYFTANNSDEVEINEETKIFSPVVFYSFVLMNNVYNLIKSQAGTENSSGYETKYNVSGVYSKVFPHLRKSQQLTNFHYQKEKIITIYPNSSQEAAIRNLEHSLKGMINEVINSEPKGNFYSSKNRKELESELKEWNKQNKLEYRELIKISEILKEIIKEIVNPNIEFSLKKGIEKSVSNINEVQCELGSELSKLKKEYEILGNKLEKKSSNRDDLTKDFLDLNNKLEEMKKIIKKIQK